MRTLALTLTIMRIQQVYQSRGDLAGIQEAIQAGIQATILVDTIEAVAVIKLKEVVRLIAKG